MLRCCRGLGFQLQVTQWINSLSVRTCLHRASTVKPCNVMRTFGQRCFARSHTHSQPVSLQQRSVMRILGPVNVRYISRTTNSVDMNQCRKISSKSSNEQEEKNSQEIMQSTYEQPQTQLTVGAKVAQAGKDVSYFAVILVGFAVTVISIIIDGQIHPMFHKGVQRHKTSALIWYVVSELVFGFSPNKVYSDALKKVKLNSEVIDAVGEPMKAYGEETSRGRRRHVSYQEYIVNGENYMRVKFYISGPKQKGTVHADVKQGSRGNFEFRFIFVEFKGFPGTVIVLDNR